MRRFAVSILLMFVCLVVLGQTKHNNVVNIDEIIANVVDYMNDDDEESPVDIDQLYEDLSYYYDNKINLPTATKEQLEGLHFLTATQIENILAYIYITKGIQSIYELQLIDGLDYFCIELLTPFVEVSGSPKQSVSWRLKDIFKYTKHQLFSRTDGTSEQKKGYSTDKYMGSPIYQQLKYQLKAGKMLSVGLCAEKDAGEQFWGNYNKGFNSYSGYMEANNLWKLDKLIVGDFRATFAQGLVLSSSFFARKSSNVMKVMPTQQGISKKSSADEYNFFRGVGVYTQLNNFKITAFYSFRSFNADTTGGDFSSFDKTGLFRTERDWAKRQTVAMQVIATNVAYVYKDLKIGASFYKNWLSVPMQPADVPYRKYAFRGSQQGAMSLDYYWRVNKFTFFGETAMTDRNAMATINGISLSPISTLNFVLLHRYFSPRYDIMFGKAFGKSSTVCNENGFYLGATVNPLKGFKLSGYADVFSFPYLRYDASAPSSGYDAFLQLDYSPQRNTTMYLRLKYNTKEKNFKDSIFPTYQISDCKKLSFRYLMNYKMYPFAFKSIIEMNFAQAPLSPISQGVALVQDISYKNDWHNLTINVHYAMFDAPKFDNRFYFYENDVPYAMSIPMLYGRGNRYAICVKMDIVKRLVLYLRLAQTIYDDYRATISSSLEEIQGNTKTDFRIALKWNFMLR